LLAVDAVDRAGCRQSLIAGDRDDVAHCVELVDGRTDMHSQRRPSFAVSDTARNETIAGPRLFDRAAGRELALLEDPILYPDWTEQVLFTPDTKLIAASRDGIQSGTCGSSARS
jgi:hypothetical protein